MLLNFEINMQIRLEWLLSSRLRHGLMEMGAEENRRLESTALSEIRLARIEVYLQLKSEIGQFKYLVVHRCWTDVGCQLPWRLRKA